MYMIIISAPDDKAIMYGHYRLAGLPMYQRILDGFTRSNFFQEVRRTPVREICGLLMVASNHEMRLLIQYCEPIFNT